MQYKYILSVCISNGSSRSNSSINTSNTRKTQGFVYTVNNNVKSVPATLMLAANHILT